MMACVLLATRAFNEAYRTLQTDQFEPLPPSESERR